MSKEVTRQCPVCHRDYLASKIRIKHGRQTTCSRKCSYQLRSSKLTKSVYQNCSTCGKELERPPSLLRGKHGSSFCSRSCHYSGRTLGLTKRVVSEPYSITDKARRAWIEGGRKTRLKRIANGSYRHSEETKLILSQKTSFAISEGRVRATSSIENLVADELDEKGIRYSRQVAIRGTSGRFSFVFDFMLSEKTALEVNGTFWHTDKRFFPDGPKYEVQRRNQQKWNRKISYAKEAGIQVIEIWEFDIKQDVCEAVNRALKVQSSLN
jgi:G:T-mismatch repair DNA endonuclease (very short patch repair protein)